MASNLFTADAKHLTLATETLYSMAKYAAMNLGVGQQHQPPESELAGRIAPH